MISVDTVPMFLSVNWGCMAMLLKVERLLIVQRFVTASAYVTMIKSHVYFIKRKTPTKRSALEMSIASDVVPETNYHTGLKKTSSSRKITGSLP